MKILTIALMLLFAAPLSAQTVTQTLQWEYVNETVGSALADATFLSINKAPTVIVQPTCTPVGTNVACAYQLPAMVKPGDVLVLTRWGVGTGLSTSGTLTFQPGQPPIGPTSMTITIKVTVP